MDISMETGAYQFTVGQFTAIAASDGGLNYPIETFFANVPRNEVEEVLRQHHLPTDRIYTPYTCLFIDTGERRLLIDTGAGNLGAAAAKMFPGINHTASVTGRLIGNLARSGIEVSTVETVIITHAHPDHIGGTLTDDGSLVFSNARYIIGEDEWHFWSSRTAAELAPPIFVDIARRNLDPVRDRLTLVRDGDEVVPGIRVVATPGHTPGHIALAISSGGETLLHISDVVLHPIHVEQPDWAPVFDMLPDKAAASKRRTFDWAAEERFLVFGHHFPPFPNLGHIRKNGPCWQWELLVRTESDGSVSPTG